MTVVEGVSSARAWRTPEASERNAAQTGLIAQTCERLSTELFDDAPATSIHGQLSALSALCDESRADFATLAPNPALDRCLGRLVDIARGQFGLDLDEATRSAISIRLWHRIVESPQLRRKAHAIRRIAACAETQMEYHYSDALIAALAERGPLALDADASRGSEACLREVVAAFPYVDNYAHLVRAEHDLLERALSFDAGAARARPRALAGSTLAFCGCGPLPLTGFMLQLATGARVVLIDRDARALAQAARLTNELQRIGVLPQDAFELRLADAGQLSYGPDPSEASNAHRHVRCDAVLVASLVPHEAKLRIAQRVRESCATAALAMILRSAAGLCAELAYEPVRTEQIDHPRLAYCGASVPRHQVLDERVSREHGACALACAPFRSRASRRLLGISDASVLNTSELYVRMPSHADGFASGMRLLCA
jgi:Nicotianamine synthase protein